MDADQRRKVAIRRVKEKRAFLNHLFVYVAVNVLLVVIWAMAGGGFFWPMFSMVFWGFGVVMHAWNAYGGGIGGAISESAIQAEMERLGGADNVGSDGFDIDGD
jgi:uncharacterized ion transporter superfamily protein YfcC